MSPHTHERRTDAGPARAAWRLCKEIGGPAVVVAAIFFAAHIDANIVACVKAIDKLSIVVEALRTDQQTLRVDVTRHEAQLAEHTRRLDALSAEARHGGH